MAVPKAIQKQIDEAERIESELQKPAMPAEPPPETVGPEPAAVAPAAEPTEPPAPKAEEPWEQRYKSLQGIYNSQVPELQRQLKEAAEATASMRGELDALKKRQESAPATPEPPQVTDKDVESFGSDLIDLIERVSRKSLRSVVDTFAAEKQAFLDRLTQLEKSIGGVSEHVVMSDKDRFVAGLAAAVPDWETINEDPGFTEWLNVIDPMSGLTRQDYLNSASQRLDVKRTVEIFKGYIAAKLPTTPTTPTPPANDLQRQVSPPRRSGAAPTVNEPNRRVYSQKEIQQFYDDVRRGLIPVEQAVQLENEINAAVAEGRVR